jgi:hypothetical protein
VSLCVSVRVSVAIFYINTLTHLPVGLSL